MTKRPFDPEHDLTAGEIDRLRWPDGNPHAMRSEIARLCSVNSDLLAALDELVEIERRDNTTDPAVTATDEHRERTWNAARAAIARAKGDTM